MTSQTKNIIISVGIISILVVGAYYIGTVSRNNTQDTNQVSQQEASQSKLTSSNSQSTQIAPYPNTTTSDSLITESKNGLVCKTIANQAAATDQASNGGHVTVLQTHFSQSLNNCYYETFSTSNGSSQTTIKSAPDDNWIAYCADTGSSDLGIYCGMHNVTGRLTQDQFHQLEQKYLTN